MISYGIDRNLTTFYYRFKTSSRKHGADTVCRGQEALGGDQRLLPVLNHGKSIGALIPMVSEPEGIKYDPTNKRCRHHQLVYVHR